MHTHTHKRIIGCTYTHYNHFPMPEASPRSVSPRGSPSPRGTSPCSASPRSASPRSTARRHWLCCGVVQKWGECWPRCGWTGIQHDRTSTIIVSSDIYGTIGGFTFFLWFLSIPGMILTRSGTRSPALAWDRMIPEVVHSCGYSHSHFARNHRSFGVWAPSQHIPTRPGRVIWSSWRCYPHCQPPCGWSWYRGSFFCLTTECSRWDGVSQNAEKLFLFHLGFSSLNSDHQFWRIEETSAMQAMHYVLVYWFQNLNPPIRPVSRSSDLSDGLVTSGLLA